MAPSCQLARGEFSRGVADGGHAPRSVRTTGVLATAVLSMLLVQAAAPAAAPAATAAADREPAMDTFELTATDRNFQNYYPTYLANGYWSMASSLSGTGATPAQIVGVMDYTANDVSRPAAIPSWNEIDYYDGAEWLNAGAVSGASHLRYRQTLDMRDGLLNTRYRWRSRAHGTDISVTSFVSMSDAHLAAVSLQLTPRFTGRIRLRFTLRSPPPPPRLPLAEMSAAEFNAASVASNQPDLASGGKRNAIWYQGEVSAIATGDGAAANTLWMEGKAIAGRTVAVGAAIALPPHLGMRRITKSHTDDGGAAHAVVLEVEGRVQSGRSYRFTKFLAASAAGWDLDSGRAAAVGAPGTRAAAAAARARGTGLHELKAAHEAAWRALWRSDILVGGNSELQRTLHSDLFYLLENSAPGTAWPAAACGFSSNYFGHVFWDNDLWVFPALLLLHPERAKSLIAFRQRTLPQALARARAHGFAGAMYPWEADPWSGEDVTPKFAVENADREIHVNGAVALAQWQYYLASGDRSWLRDKAFPVIKAVADFWVSRAAKGSAARRYEILDVTSPEEDYAHVNNEIYTNVVAHRSLKAAIAAAAALEETPDSRWREVADGLYLPTAGQHGDYFDFDPTTAHDKTDSWMATSVPMLSIPALDFDADAATLQGLFRHSLDAVGPIRGRANQMVLVMLAIQAADVGDANYFDDFVGGRGGATDPFLKPPFNVRSETPQNDSIYLLATSGGFIQAFLFGLSGLRIESHGLAERYRPTLPRQMTSLKLVNVAFRGKAVDVTISRLPSGQVVRQIEERASNE
jgi:trehalose/maltose hydrolase-like predicted phosphorylase